MHGALVAHLTVTLARMVGLSHSHQPQSDPRGLADTCGLSNYRSLRAASAHFSAPSTKLSNSEDLRSPNKSASVVSYVDTSLPKRMVDEEIILCLAALGHDVGHPGLNNAFLVSTNQSVALIYNDNAVLENYHAFMTFRSIAVSAAQDGGIFKVRLSQHIWA